MLLSVWQWSGYLYGFLARDYSGRLVINVDDGIAIAPAVRQIGYGHSTCNRFVAAATKQEEEEKKEEEEEEKRWKIRSQEWNWNQKVERQTLKHTPLPWQPKCRDHQQKPDRCNLHHHQRNWSAIFSNHPPSSDTWFPHWKSIKLIKYRSETAPKLLRNCSKCIEYDLFMNYDE